VPGMGHCGGGTGVNTFDIVTPLDQWVEGSLAPASIPASRMRNGAADRTRPLCPYPQIALYKGSGSLEDAANFSCGVQ
jgi:feruloyl esterase